jgi:cytosine/adenosine deaminase-related metal-dependent hydrolase
VTGREFYGKTLIRHMHDLGALSERTTVAHSIWVTEDDIALMGAARCSVAHNPISNQKLGAGIAPFRKLLDAGVNVALGTDGTSSNDSARMLDVMHVAAILHRVTSPVYSQWPTASEILRAATIGGARSAMIHDQTGSIEIGKKADLVMFDTNNINFTPLNDLRNHLVYCENGASVATVIVNGEIVLQDGRLTRVDENAVLEELRSYLPAFQKHYTQLEHINREFEPYFAKIHRRCCEQDVGVNRYGSPQNEWRW